MKAKISLLTIFYGVIVIIKSIPIVPYPEDALLNMVELLSKYGYPSQVEFITTEDGYILKLFRIPYGRKCGPFERRKSPVILMHGLEGSAYDFVASGPEKAIAYYLVDNCYDVWLLNNRGTTESHDHQWLNPSSHAYWRFSWHEIGIYDTRSVVDHVLLRTKQEQVHIIGHSQGNTQYYVYASMFPEEGNKKIKSSHSFGPTAFISHSSNPIFQLIGNNFQLFQTIQSVSGPAEFLPLIIDFIQAVAVTCNIQNGFLNLCGNAVFLILGYDPEQFNATILQTLATKDPGGASTMQFIHYAQNLNSGHFRQYDYSYNVDGSNMNVYGQPEPPDYAVEKIKSPMFLYYGDGDVIAVEEDVRHLAALVKNSTVIRIPYDKFTHGDFIIANDARNLVYRTVVKNLDELESF